MKKVFTFVCLFLAIYGYAYDFEKDGFYYDITSLSDLTVALTSNYVYNEYDDKHNNGASGCYSGNIVVPTSVTWNNKTFLVNEIERSAFTQCNINTLTIPNTIDYVQIFNAHIQKLIIEDGETLLHRSDIDEVNTGDMYEITDDTSIDTLYLGRTCPSRFDRIGVKQLTFGPYVQYISDYMFYGGVAVDGTLYLPENIKSIGSNAFDGGHKVDTIIAHGVERVELEAFESCTDLKVIDMPNLTYIGSGAFIECTALTEYVIPQGVATVGAYAFGQCTSLTKVTIPNSIVSFGENEYYSTTKGQIFSGCTNLKNIFVNASVPFTLDENNFDALTYVNATLHVPTQSLQAYQTTSPWSNFFNIVGDVTEIDSVCSINITGCSTKYGGYVVIDGTQYSERNNNLSCKIGDVITITFVAYGDDEEAYELGKVKVNGVDVSNQIQNNTLSLTISGNTTIDIDWDYAEPDPTLLTIKQAENGCVQLEVSKWDTYKFHIVPSENWQIHTVTYNGNDITNNISNGIVKLSDISADSELNITFMAEITGTNNVQECKTKVYGSNGCIVVKDAKSNDNISIYTEQGLLVKKEKVNSNNTTINLPKGLYIVQTNGITVKVLI